MKAWQLLDSREKWCQHTYAMDADGYIVDPTLEDAVCWCIDGAMKKCYGSSMLPARFYERTADYSCSVTYNDDPKRTWEEVHALLKELDI
jgi:hypothetical protein